MAQGSLPVATVRDSKLEDFQTHISLTFILGTNGLSFYKNCPVYAHTSLLGKMLGCLER